MENIKGVAMHTKEWLAGRLRRLERRVRRSRLARRTGLVAKLDQVRTFLTGSVLPRVERTRRRVGDERAMRRAAERERGGMSSTEANEAFARGEIKGGTHGGKAVHFEGPEHQRPNLEEPTARVERHPGGERHMSERRSN